MSKSNKYGDYDMKDYIERLQVREIATGVIYDAETFRHCVRGRKTHRLKIKVLSYEGYGLNKVMDFPCKQLLRCGE